jgi:hypothetical protein
MNEKECDQCKIKVPIDKYRKYTDREKSYAKTCKECLK